MSIPLEDLNKLDPNTFEHMVNMLALRVLGAGHTGFGPGPDGGRDGYFEGEAPYPSLEDRWSGRWYIQCKFKDSTSGKNPQKWLLSKIEEELAKFTDRKLRRHWPDNWIIATNVDPSGKLETGTFDKARALVAKAHPKLAERFHIWGGSKILSFLLEQPDVADTYAEFVTPGKVLARLYKQLSESEAEVDELIRYLVVAGLEEQRYTKLEQAGSSTDSRPGIQELFCDLPFHISGRKRKGMAASELTRTAAQRHGSGITDLDTEIWGEWSLDPSRSRVWFIKGGPGQGKSTLTQYVSQIQRAAFVSDHAIGPTTGKQRSIASEIKRAAIQAGLWPGNPRVPISVELKHLAQWQSSRSGAQSTRILAYLSDMLTGELALAVKTGMLKRAFGAARWIFVFDGLDEVPGDTKDRIAQEIKHFINYDLISCNSDSLIVCTSRPQGYSGQFDDLDAVPVVLSPLSPEQALECATPLLKLDRSTAEANLSIETLQQSLKSSAIAEIMTTPLQSHIMAVVIRDGGKPPERKWQLFSNFYQVIRKREANKNFPDAEVSRLLREEDQLLKSLHNRLGFVLHQRAEMSENAVTSINRTELRGIVTSVVRALKEHDIEQTVELVMNATTDRLVLVNTPESGDEVRFDIRPLQEFFAGEYIYETEDINKLGDRLRVIGADSHWREVVHFFLSGLIESGRKAELAVAVTVLAEINSGFDDPKVRPLTRRLAVGGIIAARLLQEGVIEQDRRTRALFRDLIYTLLGCPDAPDFLQTVSARQSRAWLSNLLADSILEQSHSEIVGSLSLLPFILEDGNPRLKEIEDAILSSTSYYRSWTTISMYRSMLDWAVENDYFDFTYTPKWLSKFLLRLLIDDRWCDLGPNTVGRIIEILHDSQYLREAAIELSIPTNVVDHIEAIFGSRSSVEEDDDEIDRKNETDLDGLIEIQYLRYLPPLQVSEWQDEVWDSLSKSTGIFKAIFWALRTTQTRSDKDAQLLRKCLGNDIRFLSALPAPVSAFFDCPLPPARTASKDVASTSSWKAGSILRKDLPGYSKRTSLRSRTASTIDWQALFDRYPSSACNLVARIEREHRRYGDDQAPKSFAEFVASEHGAQTLLSWAEKHPLELLKEPSVWGTFFSLPSVGGKLKDKVVQCAANEPPDVVTRLSSLPNKPHLVLPEDAALLPHILVFILRHRGMRRSYGDPSDNPISIGQRFHELCKVLLPGTSAIEAIRTNPEFSKPIKAAATVFRIKRLVTSNSERALEPNSIVSLYESEEDWWYVKGICIALTDQVFAELPGAIELVSVLFQKSRGDIKTRTELTDTLSRWREMAKSPVHRHAQDKLWS